MNTFCEKLTLKDKMWEDLLKDLSVMNRDHIVKVMMDVVSLLVLTFTKRNDESLFDLILAESEASTEQPSLRPKLREASDLIFQGIAMNQPHEFNIAETILSENIKYSFGSKKDVVSLNTQKLNSYQYFFIEVYRSRNLFNNFLSANEAYRDPLRVPGPHPDHPLLPRPRGPRAVPTRQPR